MGKVFILQLRANFCMPEEKVNNDGNQSLEELIEQSLSQTLSFDTALAVLQQRGKEKPSLQQRIFEKIPAAAAVANAALSIPGNPVYTPAAVGAVTYFLSGKAAKIAAGDKRAKHEKTGSDTPSTIYNRLFTFKPYFTTVSLATAFAGSVGYDLHRRQIDLGSGFSDFYSGLFQQLPNLTSEVAFSLVNGLGAYVLLSGLERVLHYESLATAAHIVAAKFDKIIRKPKKAISHLERLANVPHSKEKEVAILLKLGDACLEAGENAEAMNAYKRMLRAAARNDESAGVSDWLVKRVGKNNIHGSSDEDVTYTKVQRAMHEFANRNVATANSLLTQAVAAEPRDRQLHRVRALFFEATKNEAAADLEMRIYSQLLRHDPNLAFTAVGESRNEVLVDPDGDVYIKRSINKASLDEEVENITAFSRELPGMLPRVIRQGFDGQHHYIELESMGSATMLQKALKGTLTYQDVKSVLDLLVKVLIAGEKLAREGKIRTRDPVSEQTYYLTIAAVPSVAKELSELGVNPELPNVESGVPLYFANRITDLFMARIQVSNGVEFDYDYTRKVMEGAAALSIMFMADKSLLGVYTDFTQRNIIFDSLSGNLAGKVDWESVKMLPWLFEVVNIMEFYGPHIAPATSTELFNYVISRIEKGKNVRINRKLLGQRYKAVRPLRHLELCGYRGRDAESNPDNMRAHVFDYLLAKICLFDAIRAVPKELKQLKPSLEAMLEALEKTPILKDGKLQQEIELELRHHIVPSIPYLLHEAMQGSYWREFFRLSPKSLANEILHRKKSPYKDSGFALPATFFIGLPSTMAAIAAYVPLSYAAMQKIMPNL